LEFEVTQAAEIYTKTSWEKFRYQFNFPSSVTSISSVATIFLAPTTDPALVLTGLQTNANSAQFWLSGGSDGSDYRVVLRIVDQDSTQREGCGAIRIRDYPVLP
jgi:hypothetical protein